MPIAQIKSNPLSGIICFLLVLLFIYAAFSKLIDFKSFQSDMNNQPFPDSWTPFLTWSIPAIEIAIAGCLLFQTTTLTGLYASLFVMIVFTIYILLVLLHVFPYVPCSCGGVINKLTWPQHLIFNVFFVSIAAAGIVIEKNKYKYFKNLFMHENRTNRKPV